MNPPADLRDVVLAELAAMVERSCDRRRAEALPNNPAARRLEAERQAIYQPRSSS